MDDCLCAQCVHVYMCVDSLVFACQGVMIRLCGWVGVQVVDFGQNLAGWARLFVKGSAGSNVTMKFAEVLQHPRA